MTLSLSIKPSPSAVEFYQYHGTFNNGDSGLDLFFTETIVIPPHGTVLINLEIVCQMVEKASGERKSYLLMPRSSIYKTPLRMSNSVGLIDSYYTGSLHTPVDNISDQPYTITKGTRLFQIVAGSLEPFEMKLVESIETTGRGTGGFGSTGA
jgi:dUTP pyrophosphatase